MTIEKIYKVVWKPSALKQLKKLKNKKVATEIEEKVNEQLVKDPWGKGERLESKYWKGFWKYRVRDYRVIYKIYEREILIEIFEVEDRKNAYKLK